MLHCERWRILTLFVLTLSFALLCVLAEALFLPSLPHIARDFAIDDHSFEACSWVLYCGVAFSILWHGFLADYFGRVVSLLSGYTFVMAGSLLSLFANDPQEFFLSTTILSFGLGSSVLLCRILAKDLFQGDAFVQMLAIISFCTLSLTPLAPWIAYSLLPYQSWQVLFTTLFALVAILFLGTQLTLQDTRIRRVISHKGQPWSLQSLYRPSVGLAGLLAILNAGIVFLYQSAVCQIFTDTALLVLLSLPSLATLMSTMAFRFSHTWRSAPVRYMQRRYAASLLLALLGAAAWNLGQQAELFGLCFLGVFLLQSIVLSIAMVHLLQDKISIGLSASLVSSTQHVAIGIALLLVPVALRNSPKDLIILIPITILCFYPALRVAKFLVGHTAVSEQEFAIPSSLSG